jgi:hypothetical protein
MIHKAPAEAGAQAEARPTKTHFIDLLKNLSDARPLACFTSVLEDPFNLRRNG